MIAIGASAGGTVAIQEILLQLPADMPPMVVTQHIPAGFSLAFANPLNKLCSMEVCEAVNGDALHPGLALVAPGDFHLLVRRAGSDVMFASVAQTVGAHSVGILLTGMGTDGAKGMLALKRAGAPTIAQDQASCVVYGMPREAKRLDAVGIVASLHDIGGVLTRTLKPQERKSA